jgi:hypothetical protein
MTGLLRHNAAAARPAMNFDCFFILLLWFLTAGVFSPSGAHLQSFPLVTHRRSGDSMGTKPERAIRKSAIRQREWGERSRFLCGGTVDPFKILLAAIVDRAFVVLHTEINSKFCKP